jgi:hypothetical protein
MAGTLAGAAFTSGITMSVYERFGTGGTALTVAALAGLPSLAAITVRESQPIRAGFRHTVNGVKSEITSAFKSRRTLLAMLCLAAPVGPGAAINLFPAIGREYKVSSEIIIVLTGFCGSLLGAGGCLLGGFIADRLNRWRAYFATSVAIGVFATMVAVAPQIDLVFTAAVPVYMVLAGIANATYTAVLLEIIADRSRATGALYTWLNNLGNLPMAYMTWLDGQGHRLGGTAGLFAVDGVGNIVPAVLLFWIVARAGVNVQARPHVIPTQAASASS